MPHLTRRREPDRHQDSWHIMFADVEVGWIGERAGVPKDVEQWGWHVGFYPVSHRGIRAAGIAGSFAEARAAFEAAWALILPQCSDDDFAQNRFERAFLRWKYRMWSEGHKLPTQ